MPHPPFVPGLPMAGPQHRSPAPGWALMVAGLLAGAPVSAAVDARFDDLAAFQAAAGATLSESFEGLAARTRGGAAVVTPLVTVRTTADTLGVQSSPTSPETGHGTFATDGSQYLLLYAPGLPPGEIRFDLTTDSRAFGIDLTDLETLGSTILLFTDRGAFSGGVTLETVTGNVGNGSQRFLGITQAEAFSSVRLSFDGVDEALGLDLVRTAPVPEPGALALWAAGLAWLGWRARRR